MNDNTGFSHCSTNNNFHRHCQVNLLMIESMHDQLKKSQKDNSRLRVEVAKLRAQLTEKTNAVESPKIPIDVENNVEDWERPDSVTTDNYYEEDDSVAEGSNCSPPSADKSSNTNRVKVYSLESCNTDNNSLGDSEYTRGKDELESKNVIPNEEAKEIFASAKLKWDYSPGNSDKKLYSTISYHKKFVTSDDNVFLPEEKPAVTVGVHLPQWIVNEVVFNDGSNKTADKQQEDEDEGLRGKRHAQHEVKEQKRKRLDNRLAREEERVATLKANKKRKSKSFISLLPPNLDQISEIYIGDCCVPIDAFGVALPQHTMTEYHCDRIPMVDGQ